MLAMERLSSGSVSGCASVIAGSARLTRVEVLVAVLLALLVAITLMKFGLRDVALVAGFVEVAAAHAGLTGHVDLDKEIGLIVEDRMVFRLLR